MGSGAQVERATRSLFNLKTSTNMKVLALLLAAVPALNALCLVNSCDSYWSGAQAKLKKDGACAVLFDDWLQTGGLGSWQWHGGRNQRGEEGLQPGRLQEHEGHVRPEQAHLQSGQNKAPLGRGD